LNNYLSIFFLDEYLWEHYSYKSIKDKLEENFLIIDEVQRAEIHAPKLSADQNGTFNE